MEAIQAAFPSGDATKHESRFAMQTRGEASYLFAWIDETPIGHVLLLWNGTLDEPVASNLRECPHLEDLFVQEENRSKGVGTTLLNAAERCVKTRGFHQIGLAVGTDNPTAKRLYQRIGYAETSFGTFYSSWVEVNKQGEVHEYKEEIVYLVKSLCL